MVPFCYTYYRDALPKLMGLDNQGLDPLKL